MDERHRIALLRKMRSVLAEGKSLVILGWRDSNHDPHTRQLSKEGRVIFFHRVPTNLGNKVGLVLSNQFVGHSEFERIKVREVTHPVVISNGNIKKLLKKCDDLLHPPAAISLVEKTVAPGEKVETLMPVVLVVVPIEETLTALLDQGPREVAVTQQPMDEFARLFKIEAEKTRDSLVSKNVVGEIRRAAGIKQTNSMLATEGWLEAVTSEGATNAGKYRATEKLLGHAGEEIQIDSNDPLVRARRLVAEKANIVEQIMLQEVVLFELKEKLKKIEGAEAILAQLEALMK